MYLLGINGAYHESAACLVEDGIVVAAIEEERLTRRKHGKSADPASGDELPRQAIAWCLAQAGIALSAVESIGYSIDPTRRLQTRALVDRVEAGGWGSAAAEELFFARLQRVPEQLQALGFVGEFKWLGHHLCHAASAYYPSPFTDAAVLCIDGIGETGSALLAHGRGRQLDVLDEIAYPASLGFLWEKLAKFLGFSEYDACKVMGLASYGDPTRYREPFARLVQVIEDGAFAVDSDALCFRVEDYAPLAAQFDLPKRSRGEPVTRAHEDLAAALQEATNRVVSHLVAHIAARTGAKDLCMAGGVALNCVANRIAFEASRFERLYVQPAAHDAGTALGAALVLWHGVHGQEQRGEVRHPYTGPRYDDEAIERALLAHGLRYTRSPAIEQAVAERLAAGRIVGWFQGALEFGPRALGNRSLLADPRAPDMKQVLNDRVKHREPFRPFAPSVLVEHAEKWFRIERPTPAADFMLMAYPVREEVRVRVPAVVHVDGTSRIQTVRADTNPRYHRMISAFHRITGVPLVLNTSFNDNEPIVCSPDDAIRTFKQTRIDVLALGDFLVEVDQQRPEFRQAAV